MFKNLSLGALGHSAAFDVTCALAKKHGFAGVDLDLGYLAKLGGASAARDWFAATGLRTGGIGLSVKWRDWDNDEAFKTSLATFKKEAALAAALGVTRCYTYVMPCSNTHTFRQNWDLVIPRLAKVAKILAGHGMRLGFEFVGPATLRAKFKYDFVHTLDGIRAFNAAIGPNVGMLLDCFHSYTAHASLADIADLTNDEVVYVHVNDGRAGLGPDEQIDQEREMVGATGVIDIKGFVKAIKAFNFDGPVTVEPFSPAVKAMPTDAAVALTSKALGKALGKI